MNLIAILLFSGLVMAQTAPPPASTAVEPTTSAQAPTPPPAAPPAPAAPTPPAAKVVEATTASAAAPITVTPKPAPVAPPAAVTGSVTAPAQPAAKKENRRLRRVLAIFEMEKAGQPAGVIKAQLFIDKAPKTVNHFIGLVEGTKSFKEFDETKGKVGLLTARKFYDGLKFHRVVPNYVIQGGCPFGTGRGGPGFTIEDEIMPDLRHDTAGILSMANSGKKDSAGSQFFITLAPLKHLDGKYTIFGKVVEGMDVVKALAAGKRDQMTEQPIEPIVMKTVSIVREYAN